jgi:nitrogen fixation/metabolism regulation signal transduction histidine kinase
MRYRHFYWAVFLRLMVIILLAGATVWLWQEKHSVVICILPVLLLILAVAGLIRYFNHVNRWISFFLLGIENGDTSLKIPEKTGNKAIDEVYRGLKRLNELFQRTKIDIHAREQYFQSIIDQSATGLFSVNEQGRVADINPVAEELTGMKRYHPLTVLKKMDEALPDFILNSGATSASAIFTNRQGRKFLFRVSSIRIGGKDIRLVAVSDITRELDTREVDSWIKLARTLSHEIMNNIVPITTLSGVVLDYFTKEGEPVGREAVDEKIVADAVRGLTVIKERSEGLMHFVENYRKFTRLPEPQIREIDLVQLIGKELMAVAALPGAGEIRIRKHLPEQFLFSTDENLLSQVLTNLLKNAVEALTGSGVDDPELTVSLEEGQPVQITVTNNGPAIPPELQEQIFVPFFTTKDEGSGVGLSLSRQIMLSLGGDMMLISNEEQTTFAVVMG